MKFIKQVYAFWTNLCLNSSCLFQVQLFKMVARGCTGWTQAEVMGSLIILAAIKNIK